MSDAISEPEPYKRLLEIKDRIKVHVRPIRAEDEDLLHEAFSRMSERTVYLRFFSPLKRLSDEMARKLSHVDYNDRFAVVAISHKPDGKEHILGVGRYDRVPGSDTAEVAVAVIDDFQRRGLGSGLLSQVARAGKDHGIRTFTLIVLPENQSMLALLRRLGWIHQARLRGGVYEISFDLP